MHKLASYKMKFLNFIDRCRIILIAVILPFLYEHYDKKLKIILNNTSVFKLLFK